MRLAKAMVVGPEELDSLGTGKVVVAWAEKEASVREADQEVACQEAHAAKDALVEQVAGVVRCNTARNHCTIETDIWTPMQMGAWRTTSHIVAELKEGLVAEALLVALAACTEMEVSLELAV